MSMLELAERCEAGDGPDDALAMAIVRLDYDTPGGIGLGCNYDPVLWMDRHGLDPVTSMDAAMMLIPDGRHTEIAMQDRHSGRWKWGLRGGFGVRSEARASSAARALTAAALRARHALALSKGSEG
jgi:hypothetical protein